MLFPGPQTDKSLLSAFGTQEIYPCSVQAKRVEAAALLGKADKKYSASL